eukprot:32824-Eustigmatos_ZCMA.PRE.1
MAQQIVQFRPKVMRGADVNWRLRKLKTVLYMHARSLSMYNIYIEEYNLLKDNIELIAQQASSSGL